MVAAASAGGTAVQHATKAIELDGATVINGTGESTAQALEWAQTTLGRRAPEAASLLRPTPDTARLAYMMLAGMGGR